MSIEYKILWVDDSTDWVESIEGSIKSHLEEKGYDPEITLEESGAGVDTSKLADIDLIVIDYQLPGPNGDELIRQIRKEECLTEIVFYSQDPITPPAHFEDMYYETRDAAEELIKKVINETIKKTADITWVRGFIIVAAIDIENILEEFMADVFDDKSNIFLDRVINAKPPVYNAYDKFRFVKRIVKDRISDEQEGTDRYQQLKDIDSIMNKLTEEVFDQRNIFAHSKKKINDDGSTTLEGINKKKPKIEFNQEWLSSVRKDILKHKENLNRLKKIL